MDFRHLYFPALVYGLRRQFGVATSLGNWQNGFSRHIALYKKKKKIRLDEGPLNEALGLQWLNAVKLY